MLLMYPCAFLLLVSLCQYIHAQSFFGPFYYPNGVASDPISLTFGEYNTTHMFINTDVSGSYWFGFGFDQTGGAMEGTDAIVIGIYDGTISAREWILGNHQVGYQHTIQNIGTQSFTQSGQHSVSIKRPYDPSLYGDRDSYSVTYPFAESFCWMWAQGDGMDLTVPQGSLSHLNKGYQCIGTSRTPTPSPTYPPIPAPTKHPSDGGDPAHPTNNPTKDPTNAPTVEPTSGPIVPTNIPTSAPITTPTETPTNTPTDIPMTETSTEIPTCPIWGVNCIIQMNVLNVCVTQKEDMTHVWKGSVMNMILIHIVRNAMQRKWNVRMDHLWRDLSKTIVILRSVSVNQTVP
eukprot:598694_1